MKAVIFAGGLEQDYGRDYLKPKPLVGIGGMPILWHILKIGGSYEQMNLLFAVDTKVI